MQLNTNYLRAIIAAAVLMLSGVVLAEPPSVANGKEGPQTISVCELTRQAAEFDGRSVTVRGYLYGAFLEYPLILRQPGCRAGLVVANWSPAVEHRLMPALRDIHMITGPPGLTLAITVQGKFTVEKSGRWKYDIEPKAILALQTLACGRPPQVALDLCKVLTNPRRFSGKIITIHGFLTGAAAGSYLLIGRGCRIPLSTAWDSRHHRRITGLLQMPGFVPFAGKFCGVGGPALGPAPPKRGISKPTTPSSGRYGTIQAGTYSGSLMTHDGRPAILLASGAFGKGRVPALGGRDTLTGAPFLAGALFHRSGYGNITGFTREGQPISMGC